MEIVKYSQSDFLSDKKTFKKCKKMYESKYVFEDFDFSDISNLTFYIVKENDKIIGFSSYQDLDEWALICTTVMIDEYQFGEKEIELTNHIINEIKDTKKFNKICAYLSNVEQKNFYDKLNFKLYKDFKIQSPQFFEDNSYGYDLMRFVMEMEL